MTETALATRQTVTELVRAYEQCEQDIRAAFARIASAQDRFGAMFGARPDIRSHRRDAPLDFGDPENVVVSLRRACWRQLIARLELRKVMSIKRWDELWRQVDDGPDKDVPEVTVELVLGMAENFRSQMDVMLREAVTEVYEWLRPRSDYKSNSQFGIGRRVVLSYMVERAYYGWRVEWRQSQHLTALERVFRMLDGRAPTSGEGNHYSDIETAIRSIEPGEECSGETLYFKFRGFQNRNLHITFTRPDLVALLNRVAGGGMLPQKGGEAKRGRSAEQVLADAITHAQHEGFGGVGLDFFETPGAVANAAVERLELRGGMTVFEPSAGCGSLVCAVLRADVVTEDAITCVEVEGERAGELARQLRPVAVIEGDFLSLQHPLVAGTDFFDRVIMNPPFSHQRDILHVAHAFRFLKPGGVLVAIMSAGAMFREDKLSRAFREFFAEHQGEVWNNDERAFKDSGTSVRTITIRLRKASV